MSDHESDLGEHGSPALVAPAALQLQALNLDYLQLLILEKQEFHAEAYGEAPALDAQLTSAMADAPLSRLADLADCGISLFTLSLHNVSLWQRIASTGVHDAMSRRYAAVGETADGSGQGLARRSAFMECAVFYAWHLANADRRAALNCLGMPGHTADILASLQLWQLRNMAIKHPQLLAPRWPANTCFWPDLVQYLSSGDRRHLDHARLLGAQLMAQELEPSAIEYLMSRKQNLYRTRQR